EKKDSQGICFLGKVTLDEFLSQYIPEKRGLVLTAAGEKIGEHKGAHFYTIGQRHIGIMNYESGIKGRQGTKPHYVAERDIKTNTLVVAEGDENPALYKKEIELKDLNFIIPDNLSNSLPAGRQGANKRIRVLARVRYRQPLAPATIKLINSSTLQLKFDLAVKFVAPGQSAVFYNKDGELLGGGVIKEKDP
ncbi:MAG: tRNA methyl transferase PRC-barrel domain-containing protein, partial [Patescibacteria group bacterium]